MSEEAQAAEAVKEAPTQNEIEEVAKELGWNPEYEGEDAKTAKEFILNSKDIQKTQRNHAKKLQEQLESTRGEVEELRNGFSAFEDHIRKTTAAEVAQWKNRVKSLEANRKEALRDGDVDAVERIEKEIETTKQHKPEAPPKASFPGKKDVAKWVGETDWYNPNSSNHNKDAQAYADAIYSDNLIYDRTTGEPVGLKLPVARMLKKIEREVKKEFPELFEETPAQQKAPAVEGAGNRKPTGGKKTKYAKISDLPEEFRGSAKQFVEKLRVMTLDQYVEDQKKQGFLD